MCKKNWVIPVEWSEIALLDVEAETLEEAIELAKTENFGLPSDSSYLEDSFKVSPEDIEEIRGTYNT